MGTEREVRIDFANGKLRNRRIFLLFIDWQRHIGIGNGYDFVRKENRGEFLIAQ